MPTYHILGLMSGSSLDGLDIALCRFQSSNHPPMDWQIVASHSYELPTFWQQAFKKMPQASAYELAKAHVEFGHWMGQRVVDFLEAHPQDLPIDVIGSHGHTIFHEPDERFSTQIGDGAALSVVTGLPVITDFRSSDMAAGGEGAPLSVLADEWLFSDYEAALNIGGIANISIRTPNGYSAYDLCGANQLLNRLAAYLGQPYDVDGQFSECGEVIPGLLHALNQLDFIREEQPKSLSNAYVNEQMWSTIRDFPDSAEDRLRTVIAHIAQQVSLALQQHSLPTHARILVTGGGAYNHTLTHAIRQELPAGMRLVIPNSVLINFKEALLMALLAYLRLQAHCNGTSLQTGGTLSVVNGCIYDATVKM